MRQSVGLDRVRDNGGICPDRSIILHGKHFRCPDSGAEAGALCGLPFFPNPAACSVAKLPGARRRANPADLLGTDFPGTHPDGGGFGDEEGGLFFDFSGGDGRG